MSFFEAIFEALSAIPIPVSWKDTPRLAMAGTIFACLLFTFFAVRFAIQGSQFLSILFFIIVAVALKASIRGARQAKEEQEIV